VSLRRCHGQATATFSGCASLALAGMLFAYLLQRVAVHGVSRPTVGSSSHVVMPAKTAFGAWLPNSWHPHHHFHMTRPAQRSVLQLFCSDKASHFIPAPGHAALSVTYESHSKTITISSPRHWLLSLPNILPPQADPRQAFFNSRVADLEAKA
jgi:hypothetical protein